MHQGHPGELLASPRSGKVSFRLDAPFSAIFLVELSALLVLGAACVEHHLMGGIVTREEHLLR